METMTPKQIYDATMENVKKEKMKTMGIDPDEAKELDEFADSVEKTFDKSMGETKVADKHTMTSEQYHAKQSITQQRKMLENMVMSARQKLSSEERKKLIEVLDKFEKGEIGDKVMNYLLKQRGKSAQQFEDAVKEIKELERKLLDDLSKCTSKMVSAQSVLENLNKQILEIA